VGGWPTLSLTNLNEPEMIGCPILRALCEGWESKVCMSVSGMKEDLSA